MASRQKSKPSVKAKERAEPHSGSRKRDGFEQAAQVSGA